MSSSISRALIVCTLAAATMTSSATAAPVTVHERVLPNGVRVCYLHCEGANGVSIFTFLPMGLAADDAGRTQWAHLIEHLVIRTTVEGQLPNVNAETLPDHMRLDYYGKPSDWREGLAHHARWASGPAVHRGFPARRAGARQRGGGAHGQGDGDAQVRHRGLEPGVSPRSAARRRERRPHRRRRGGPASIPRRPAVRAGADPGVSDRGRGSRRDARRRRRRWVRSRQRRSRVSRSYRQKNLIRARTRRRGTSTRGTCS